MCLRIYIEFRSGCAPCSGAGHRRGNLFLISPVLVKTEPTNQRLGVNRHFENREDSKPHNYDSMEATDQWRLTPMLEHNSLGFTPLPSQSAAFFGTTPGASHPAYQSQAGDLHTPGLAFQLGTPLSLPHTDHGIQPGLHSDLHGYHPQYLVPDAFHNHNVYHHQPLYAPGSYVQAEDHLHHHGLPNVMMPKDGTLKFTGHGEVDSRGISGPKLQSLGTGLGSKTLDP